MESENQKEHLALAKKMSSQSYRDTVCGLILHDAKLKDEEMISVFEKLPLSPSLVHIDLYGSTLSDRSVKMLVSVLPKCRMLAKLNLLSAKISFPALKSLIKVLPKCFVLVEFDGLVKFNPSSKKTSEFEYKASKLCLKIVSDCPSILKFRSHSSESNTKIQSVLKAREPLTKAMLNAMDYSSLPKIKELASKKVSIWLRDDDGNTGVHSAVALDVVQYFIGQGIPFNALNYKGQTPLDLAKELKQEEKIMFLSKLQSPTDFDEKIQKDPKSANLWEARGEWKKDLSCYKAAIFDYDEAIRLEPNNAFFWGNRGAVKYALERYEEAILDLQKSKDLKPDIVGPSRLLGGSKYYLGRYQEALRDFLDAIKQDSSDAFVNKTFGDAKVALRKLTHAHYEKGNFVETISCCDFLLTLEPQDSSLWQLRANAKVKLNRNQEAIADYDETIKLLPKNVSAWMSRGEAKRAVGRNEEAVEDLMEVVRLDPNNAYAKECLKEARRKLKAAAQVSLTHINVQSQDSPVFSHEIKFSMSIPKEQLTFEKLLGEGSFGKVHKGIWSPTSLFTVAVAIKQLKNTSMSSKVLDDFKREVEVQAKLDSPGVVKLYGITSEQPYCMVMEFMGRGSLRDLLDSQRPEELQWTIRIELSVNMARGLAYLHQQNPLIIHGDLKSLNILVNDKCEAKLADFGLAALKTESRSKEYVGGHTEKNKGPKGSLLWLAPELFRMNAKRTPASDIFSFAVVLWELASHLFPYESAEGNESLIKDWVTTGEREAFDERAPNTPKEYADLTQRCWDAKPENRPKAEELVVKLEGLYSSMPLAPTIFSSGAKLSPKIPNRPSVGSGGYMANTGSVAAPAKAASYMGNVYK